MSLTKTTYSMIDGAHINVHDYGAVGNNIVDDTIAIQAAMNAAMAVGKKVFFPAGEYKITDTISLLNSNWVKAFGFFGENGRSTTIYFHNAVSLKNMFFVDTNVNYLEIKDLQFFDNTARTSRAFYFRDLTPDPDGALPAWKHLFQNVRFYQFKEAARFDGATSTVNDAHCSEVMFLHSKTFNCETALVYNNTQAVNHQLIGFDMENDAESASDEWVHIKMERGTTINHLGGSVIGNGPYLSYEYTIAGGFQDTSQFSSKGVRIEKRGGTVPIINHSTNSVVTLSNSIRIIIDDMPVVSASGSTLFARFGGRTYAQFSNIHSNNLLDVQAYMTSNLAANGEYGAITLYNCNNLQYSRISTVSAYGGTGVLSSNYRSIPAETSFQNEGLQGANDGSGYYTLNNPKQTIYYGGWQATQLKTMVYANPDSSGFGSGSNPATAQINLPKYGRPCKFRLLRDDINAGDAFQLTLSVVVSGVDYTVATITPTSGTGGHFEADIQTATGMTYFINDGVNWDGKMKVAKSGTSNGYVGLIMIDYM